MQKLFVYKNYLIVAIICIITFICFQYTAHNQFTCWDDDYYVTNDPYIKALTADNLKVIFTKDITKNNYHPLCMLSLAINYFFTQLNPESYYLTNIFIHICNVVLVFLFISLLCARLKMTENARLFIAGFSALWFGTHPMHVESVSWIAERKDVLYAFFYIAGMITYLKYSDGYKMKWYWATLGLFIASCLSKPMAVVFPLSLVCIDFLVQREWDKKVVTDKIVFLLISLICGGGAYYTQNATGAIADFNKLTIAERVMYASYGFDMYISKFFNPTYLSTFYPYPYRFIDGYLPNIYYAAPFLALALPIIPLVIAYKIHKKKTLAAQQSGVKANAKLKGSATQPVLTDVPPVKASFTLPFNPKDFSPAFRVIAFGFAYLFANLVFVLQFISCGAAIMADRYSYVAYIGWLFMIAFFLNEIITRLPGLKVAVMGTLLIISGWFAWLCYQRTYAWHDSETLLSDAIEKYPMRALLSYKWLGNYYLEKGDLDKALENYGVLTMLHAADAKVYDNTGNIYARKRDFQKAIEMFNESIKVQNNVYKTYLDRALAYTQLGDTLNASRDYQTAYSLNPSIASGMGQGDVAAQAQAAPNTVDPEVMKALTGNNPKAGAAGQGSSKNLDSCLLLLKTGDTLRAFRNFILAYKFNPGAEKIIADQGFNFVQTKQYPTAINLYNMLLKLNTANPFYYFYRGVAKYNLNQTDAGIEDWLIAVKMKSKDVQQSASNNLSVALEAKGNYKDALYYAEMSKSLGYNVDPAFIAKLKEKLGGK